MLRKIYAGLVAVLILGAAFSSAQTYPVTRTKDGDTFVAEIDGVLENVRVTGIDTPETKRADFYASEATEFTRSLLEGQEVRLEYDVERRDRYERLLAYVYLPDGRQLNLLLAEGGFAEAYPVAPNERYRPLYAAAMNGAKSVRKGRWQNMATRRFDRNCKDFATQDEAQAFFIGAQGASRDPHRLDSDMDGQACAALPRFVP